MRKFVGLLHVKTAKEIDMKIGTGLDYGIFFYPMGKQVKTLAGAIYENSEKYNC